METRIQIITQTEYQMRDIFPSDDLFNASLVNM